MCVCVCVWGGGGGTTEAKVGQPITMMKGRPQLSRTTRTSRSTGETASHYGHLEFERSYDEGRAFVNSCGSHESYNW